MSKEVKIRVNAKPTVKVDLLGEYPDLLKQVTEIAENLSREELAVFWISTFAGEVESKEFKKIYEGNINLDKDTLLGILDELSKKDAERFLRQFSGKKF